MEVAHVLMYLVWCITDGETEEDAKHVTAWDEGEACEKRGEERYSDEPFDYDSPVSYGVKAMGCTTVSVYEVRAEPSISMSAVKTKDGDRP